MLCVKPSTFLPWLWKNSSEHFLEYQRKVVIRGARNRGKFGISNEPCNFLSSAATRSSLREPRDDLENIGSGNVSSFSRLIHPELDYFRWPPKDEPVVPSRSIPAGNQIIEWFDVHFPLSLARHWSFILSNDFENYLKVKVKLFREMWIFNFPFLFLLFLEKKDRKIKLYTHFLFFNENLTLEY